MSKRRKGADGRRLALSPDEPARFLDLKVEADFTIISGTQMNIKFNEPLRVKVRRQGIEIVAIVRSLEVHVDPKNQGLMELVSKMGQREFFLSEEENLSREKFLADSATGSLMNYIYKRNHLPQIHLIKSEIPIQLSFDELNARRAKLDENTRLVFLTVVGVDSEGISVSSGALSINYFRVAAEFKPTNVHDQVNMDLLDRLERVRQLHLKMNPPFLGTFRDEQGRQMIYITNPESPRRNVVQFPGSETCDKALNPTPEAD